MKVYTYSDARQNLSELLNQAKAEELIIKRRDRAIFSVKAKEAKKIALLMLKILNPPCQKSKF